MDHFGGASETERYNNAVLNEIRKTNQLLEQILNKGDVLCQQTFQNQGTLSKGKQSHQSPRQKAQSTPRGKRVTSKM